MLERSAKWCDEAIDLVNRQITAVRPGIVTKWTVGQREVKGCGAAHTINRKGRISSEERGQAGSAAKSDTCATVRDRS